MNFNKLTKFAVAENKRLRKRDKRRLSRDAEVFAMVVKLMEELGELSEEILFHYSLQRKDKSDKFKDDNLKYEFADVILCSLLIADLMKIDVEKSLQVKMKKIENRYKKLKLGHN